MEFDVVTEPLLTLPAVAVVNRANVGLQYADGLCGEIFRAAGKLKLQRALCSIGTCAVGSAVLTDGFGLNARYIIHAVPPRWCGGKHGEDRLLAGCYTKCLDLVNQFGISSVAFPLLSEGCSGYPLRQGLRVAISAITQHPAAQKTRIWLTIPPDAAV